MGWAVFALLFIFLDGFALGVFWQGSTLTSVDAVMIIGAVAGLGGIVLHQLSERSRGRW